MKHKLMTMAAVLFLAAVLALPAQAGFNGRRGDRHMAGNGFFAGDGFLPVHGLLRAKDELGLSDEQVKKITGLADAHAQQAIQSRADMQVKALKLRAVAGELNLAAAEKLIRELAAMRAEMQISRLRLQKEVRNILTAEQADKAAQLRKEFRADRRGRMGRRSGRPGRPQGDRM